MTLDVVDVNGYARPGGVNATVTYRHNARSLRRVAPRCTEVHACVRCTTPVYYACGIINTATYDIPAIYAPRVTGRNGVPIIPLNF